MGLLARDFDNMAERLQRLADARQELIRNVSHELRTPLTRIQVAVELARRKGSGADTELARIATETGKLDELIGQLMDLTRLDDPKIEMGRETFDLADLLDHVVAAAEIEAGAKGVAIDWSKPEPLPVEADAALLGSAIENVLRNAIRFSPGGGAVTVRLAPPETDAAGQMARIRIADHGPGVPDSELEAIFDPFHQVDRARSPDRGGKGLGLAIAAGVIRRHDGRIEASNREDGGLQVRILIPARAGD
jgi:two-component system sensor histidine kinase CpxA